MKQGGHRKAYSGFTIIETLIVLAVTGLLFFSAVVLINGRQGRAQFTTAINGLQQQLQQIVNETASGYYPNNANFTCNGATQPVTFAAGTNRQGTNGGCIFLGKAVQFGLGGGPAAGQLGVIPMVGNQYKNGSAVQLLADTLPRAVYQTSTPAITDAVATMNLEGGLTVATSNGACSSGGMCYTPIGGGGSTQPIGMIAFLAGDSAGQIALPAGSGNIQSGAQPLSLYAVKTSVPNESYSAAAIKIGNTSAPAVSGLDAASKVMICVASATTNDSGLFTIDNSLHVTLDIRQGTVCA